MLQTQNYLPSLPYLTAALFADLLMFALPARAQPHIEAKNQAMMEQIIFQENFDPPGDGRPKDTVGAGSRDGQRCSSNEPPIRVLMSDRNYGLTLQERPSIFVDLPETSAKQAILTFQDEEGKNYQRAFLPIPAGEGIVSFALPEDKTPLVAGKNYQWSLVLVCGETVQPDDPLFRGWVQRVEQSPELESQLSGQSMLEQAQWYGQNGYWYDLLFVLERARRSQPEDVGLKELWQNLLAATGLGDISTDP